MEKTTDFPRGLFAQYAEKAITRAQFIASFTAWQMARGMDYTCRGYAYYPGMTGVTYRGKSAVFSDGEAIWVIGSCRDERGKPVCVCDTARSVTEFKRKVDFAQLREYLWKGGDRCREVKL